MAKRSQNGKQGGKGASKDSLRAYREKRDPVGTTEPFDPEPTRSGNSRDSRDSGATGATGDTRQGRFVVHLHAASRLHYDLRLEIGTTLASFAVPKGPSLDPAEKRLAIHTEDHPLGYLDFEDVIPAGNYGAGAMIIWDRGRVRYLEQGAEAGREAGKLDFELQGHKLRGRFALVKTSGRRSPKRAGEPEQWLLIKKQDAFSEEGSDLLDREPRSVLSGLTVDELPEARRIAERISARAAEVGAPEGEVDARRLVPMLCATEGGRLDEPERLYELKIDGVRILATKRGDEVALTYRTHRAAAGSYPEIARAVRALVPDRFVLDGEIVAFDNEGHPSFQRLARRIHAVRPSDVQFASLSVPVVYLVFDLLEVDGRDLTGLPLHARKELLSRVVPGKGLVRVLDHIEGRGDALFAFCEEHGLEGVVGKRADSPYRPGPERHPDWVKFKCEQEADFIVVGYTLGTGGRKRLGALDLASLAPDGSLVIRGKVGSGFRESTIDELLARLRPIEVAEAPVADGWMNAKQGRRYVRPELVVNVRFQDWTDDGHLRAPVFHGIRDDVATSDCTAAPPLGDDAILATTEAETPDRSDTRTAGRRRVGLTNQRKVFWPTEGYTKGDLCDYYDAIAPFLLPYLEGRPVVLVRYPDGIEGKRFFQWNAPRGTPSWIRLFPVRSEDHDGKDVTTFIVDDVDTLLHIANLGCIPIHVLAARAGSLAQADWLTIDFDLGEGTLRDAIVLARELKGILDDIGLPGFPKTSGQTGLHVLVPLGGGTTFETAKTLAELLGRLVVARHPDLGTMERIKERRGPRVYVDTGQTGRSRTIVAPWSVRAHPGATVSTPLEWDEVGFALDPRRFDIFTAPERASAVGDPMRAMLEAEPDVPAAVEALGELLGSANEE